VRASSVMLGLVLAVVLAGCGADTDTPFAAPAPAEISTSRATQMPTALRASYLAARQDGGGEAYRFERALSGRAAGHNAACEIDVALADGALGVTRAGGSFHAALRWTGLGRGSQIVPVARPETEADVAGNRATYRRADGSEEQYVNGPLGVEQGFVLSVAPARAGGEALTVEVTVSGELAPVLAPGGTGVALRDVRGATMARYTDLAAFDADGVSLRAWIEVHGGAIRLRVDDDGARYPLRIDPLLWTQEAELTAGDGAAGDNFGVSVSVSGGTAIVGAPYRDQGEGAAYVFVQNGATWTQQAEIVASDGAANDAFGYAVSVSGDAAIVGAINHTVGNNYNGGAAYVFVRSDTVWLEQAELAASDVTQGDNFGGSVSMSGSTAIVGAVGKEANSEAAAYVFVQSGTTWTQQAKLIAKDTVPGDGFAASVSVSGDIAIVGAYHHGTPGAVEVAGAAYVFERSGATWAQQAELTPGDGAVNTAFGFSVSVSGGTVIVGAHGDNAHAGAAYVFEQSGTTWAQQAELTASDGAAGDDFGGSVSVSGGTAIVGAGEHRVGGNAGAGTAYLFLQSGTTWTQEAELGASDGAENDGFGYTVSVSGGTAIAGAIGHQAGRGAAYVFELCVIGGAVYASGTTNPANPCEVCAPSISTTAWSSQACTPPDGGSSTSSSGGSGSSSSSSSGRELMIDPIYGRVTCACEAVGSGGGGARGGLWAWIGLGLLVAGRRRVSPSRR
jgi:MYXO-CTERM domain-containing protein